MVTNKGSADITVDAVLGPTFDDAGVSKTLIFSYDRNATLQWAPKPFLIHELNLQTLEKTSTQVLPDSFGYLGSVNRYSFDTSNHRIRIVTANPYNLVEWDYQNKTGSFIKALSTNAAIALHHWDAASDNMCIVDKLGTAYRLHRIKNGTDYSLHSLVFLPAAASALLCEDQFAYFSVKVGTAFKLYALDLNSNVSQIINDTTNPASAMPFYYIAGEQYTQLTTKNPLNTAQNINTRYKMNGFSLTVSAFPVVAAAKSFDIKLDLGRATKADPRVPVRIKQLKPVAATAYTEVKLSFNTRPEVISYLFSRNSQLYLAGKAISKYASGAFTKIGNPYSLIMSNFIKVEDKFYMTNGGTQVYVYDPTKAWTFEQNYLTTAASAATANPKLLKDFKADGIVAIKKILPHEDKVVIGGTVDSKTKSKFVIYDSVTHEFTSNPAVSFDINDFVLHDNKIFATTISSLATPKLFFAIFDADTTDFDVKYPTIYPGNMLIKLFSMSSGHYLSSTKQFIRLANDGAQNQSKTFSALIPKLIKTPNNKFMSIINNQLVIVKNDGTYDVITNLAPLNIVVNDFELVDNKLYIATKYGIIYEIKIPLATLTLND